MIERKGCVIWEPRAPVANFAEIRLKVVEIFHRMQKMSTWHWIQKTQSHVDWCVCTEFYANPSLHKVEVFQCGPRCWTEPQMQKNDEMMIKRQEKFNIDTTARLGRKAQFGIIYPKMPNLPNLAPSLVGWITRRKPEKRSKNGAGVNCALSVLTCVLELS